MITMEERIMWFNKYFLNTMYEEQWFISTCNNGHDTFYCVRSYLKSDGEYALTQHEAISIAQDYGWIFNEKTGDIIDYDINKLIRNRHLLTGSELGLL